MWNNSHSTSSEPKERTQESRKTSQSTWNEVGQKGRQRILRIHPEEGVLKEEKFPGNKNPPHK